MEGLAKPLLRLRLLIQNMPQFIGGDALKFVRTSAGGALDDGLRSRLRIDRSDAHRTANARDFKEDIGCHKHSLA